MDKPHRLKIGISDHVPWARAEVRRFAKEMGFEDKLLAEIELCVSELATNLVVHNTTNGQLTFEGFKENGLEGIEIISTDDGPGIKNLEEALRGGLSSAGSLGEGLSSVQRIADEFEIHSSKTGTRVSIRKYLPKPKPAGGMPLISVSVVVRTHPESPVCGDGYVIRHNGLSTMVAVIDGLGHGEKARHAAAKAEAYLHANHRKPLSQMPAELHNQLRSTRGAVVGIARIDETEGKLYFVGVGNISARLWMPAEKTWARPVSMSGTLGVSLREPRIFAYRWQKGSLLVVHSDGIKDAWELDHDQFSQTPAKIAAYILQGYWRRSDDATVLVAK